MKKFLIAACAFIYAFACTPSSLNAIVGEALSYEEWAQETIEKLASKSKIAETVVGPIEYIKEGYGPVVVAVHSTPGGYEQSKLISHHIASKGFTVISFSRPGYLRTPLYVGSTIEQQADAIAALLDTLKIEQAAVLGYSSGAPIAFQFALRHPTRTWGLVLESLGANPSDDPLYQIINVTLQGINVPDLAAWFVFQTVEHDVQAAARWILPIDSTLSASELKNRVKHVTKNSKQLDFLKALVYTALPLSVRAEGISNDLSQLDPWASYPYNAITVPTIIIEAAAENNNRYAEAAAAAQSIPGAQLVTVQESGHFIWLGGNVKPWQKKLINFLKENSPRAH